MGNKTKNNPNREVSAPSRFFGGELIVLTEHHRKLNLLLNPSFTSQSRLNRIETSIHKRLKKGFSEQSAGGSPNRWNPSVEKRYSE